MVATVKFALIVYLLVVLLLYVNQRKLLYFPTPASLTTSELEITFTVNEQHLQAWQLNPGQSHALLYFGGNAEQVETNIDEFSQIFSNYSVYLIAYRGYGASTGTPTETALNNDALAIYDQLSVNYDNISVMGRSLGSGIAVHLSSKRKINKMILVTPYDSLVNVAQDIYWMLPLSILLKDKYESWHKVADIEAETLLLIAGDDEVIPAKYGNNLARYFVRVEPSVKVIKNATHNTIDQFKAYRQALKEFSQ